MALSGDGGDELFGGYPGYYIVRAIDRVTAGLSPLSRRLVAGAADGLSRASRRCTDAFRPRAGPDSWPIA